MMRLVGGRVINGKGACIEEASIVIGDDGRIECVQAGPTNLEPGDLDLRGHTVLPGLFDCHVHLMSDASSTPFNPSDDRPLPYFTILGTVNAARLLSKGVTTVRDLGSYEMCDVALKRAIESGLIAGPRLLISCQLLTMTGGHGWFFGQEVDGADEVRKYARRNLKMGADNIKMMASGGVLTPNVSPKAASLTIEELEAGFGEAAKAGKLSAAHAQSNRGIKNAIRAGARTIEHGFWLDEEACEMMIERGTYYTPTLAAMHHMLKRQDDLPDYVLDKIKRFSEDHYKSFQLARKMGVSIICGTDAGTPFNIPGDVATELEVMHELGMSPADAVVAATSKSAEAMRLDDVTGTVETGKMADLLVVKGHPLEDLSVLREPVHVFREGWHVPLESLGFEPRPEPSIKAAHLVAVAERVAAHGCACC